MHTGPSGDPEREKGREVSRRSIVRVLGGIGVAGMGLMLGVPADGLAGRLPGRRIDSEGKKRFAIKKEIIICYQNQTLRVATKAFLKGRYPGAITGACPA